MNLFAFRSLLAEQPAAAIHVMLPDGDFVPAHFHVTEVGRVRKDFIDCGGTTRSATACVLQLWVSDDLDHRLTAGRLAQIVRLANELLGPDDLPVEVEYDTGYITQLPLTGVEVTPRGLLLHLGGKHTACLAPQRCGVPGTAGCC